MLDVKSATHRSFILYVSGKPTPHSDADIKYIAAHPEIRYPHTL